MRNDSSCLARETLKEEREGQPSMATIVDAVVKECRKDQMAYRLHALQYIGEILEAHSDIDRFHDIADILFPKLEKVNSKYMYLEPMVHVVCIVYIYAVNS